MPRYKITIEYDGTGLAGWQRQDDVYSVQEAVENAILGFSQETQRVQSAGRTDAGVHAFGQIAHFDLEKDWDEFRVQEALNHHLRKDRKLPIEGQVAILDAKKAAADFDARFSAKKRYYLYRIINRRAHLALERSRAWCVHEELDPEAMHKAAQILLGNHDFTSFRAAECQAKSPVKTLDRLEVKCVNGIIEIRVEALSFLHHMVRNIVGSLRLVGNGKWSVDDLQNALKACDRAAAGETAPAHGLYFVKVDY
ncbi:MAG: tRNA pseudouridine(38-40) synthase TruA [Alphaproteobacteria bacterium CG11_big_fil_rev_8_21_14_0_20_44_7]|nr:MAG: tRNA pseudouridine(38-40) synthase TruA [Alphaproteobacteria bacterium CG11_big_fil_rev_8_21_14_0_20_44_7]